MKYDVVVIGSGPGGYVGAIRCAQLGLKTAIVEKYNTLGGTCLNVGCIPSKALLDSSEHFHNAAHSFEKHGIEINSPKVNMAQMIARKNSVVKQTCDGVQYLMDKNKIDVHTGLGSFVNKNIDLFDMSHLLELDKFLNFEDEIILNFYHNNIIKKKINENKISKIFKSFKL